RTSAGRRAGVEPEELAVTVARLLRGSGLDVPVGSVTSFVDALGVLGVERRQGVYWAGRTTLVRRPEDVPDYDRAFGAFWLGREPVASERPDDRVAVAFDAAETESHDDGDERSEAEEPVVPVRWSPVEVLKHKDFAAYSHAEFVEARRLMADIRLAGALRP